MTCLRFGRRGLSLGVPRVWTRQQIELRETALVDMQMTNQALVGAHQRDC
jgi:hypothetical protein